MRRTSLVHAKARLSKLVDVAERKGELTIICRHGKPAAAIVPVAIANEAVGKRIPPRMTPEEIESLLERLAASGDHGESALEDLYEGRSRLELGRTGKG